MEGCENMAKCPNCGAPMQGNECSYCHYTDTTQSNGSQIHVNVYNQQPTANIAYVSPKSKWCAFLLCLFFGCFGVHKFYVGKIGMGIVYLLTMGLFGFGWFIDLILIACGSFKDSNGMLLKK